MGLKERRNYRAYEAGAFKNPEWQLYKAKEFRMKHQFGQPKADFGVTETALDFKPIQEVTIFDRIKNVIKHPRRKGL